MALDASEGYICVLIACVCFGSNFVLAKVGDAGDGVMFQWCMCAGVWTAGLVVAWHQGFPTVPCVPAALLGGACWALGNACAVPVINRIGLSLGLCIWGTTNMLMGWAVGVFGLFGYKKDVIHNHWLNASGAAFAAIAAAVFAMIKSKPRSDPSEHQGPLMAESPPDFSTPRTVERGQHQRMIGIFLALFSGILYGLNFVPVFVDMEAHKHIDNNILDYVFWHFQGIFVMSTIYVMLYCAKTKLKPFVNPKMLLPGYLSGLIWATAQVCWFLANDALGFSIAYPLITSGPGMVGCVWGIFVFKEITGKHNLLLTVLGFVLLIGSAAQITASKN